MKSDKQRVKYYESFEHDFEKTRNQNYTISSKYKWQHPNIFYRFFATILYFVVLIIDLFYMKFVAHITVKNRHLLAASDSSYYLYCNHTLLFGDVVNPFYLNFPTRPAIICSPSNLGIPIIGKLLPMAGALPIPNDLNGMKSFTKAISDRLNSKKCVVIYPEQHLWPYYTKIRPLSAAAFHYPALDKKPIYVATTTFQKSIFHKRPNITIYIDGPFQTASDISRKKAQKQLMEITQKVMKRRSQKSDYEYIQYKQKVKK